jgi:hypothetical protein
MKSGNRKWKHEQSTWNIPEYWNQKLQEHRTNRRRKNKSKTEKMQIEKENVYSQIKLRLELERSF